MKMDKFLVSGVGEDNPVVPTADQVDEPRNRVVMIGRVGV
jgi:outer membrane protein OmpA-like peptidoglycan-associated protein